jgi:hypothetical protein
LRSGSKKVRTFEHSGRERQMPSNKWWAARITALTGLAIMWVTTGSWDTEETVAAITLVSAGLISWLVPNSDTP